MCIGKYGDIPKMPAFPYNGGPEVFKGQVMHTLDYCKLNDESADKLMRGKKVVIIGYKKSAIDLAVECAEANRGMKTDDGENFLTFMVMIYLQKRVTKKAYKEKRITGEDGQPCTMVIRTLHWTVPHYSIWGLPFFLFFSTRSAQFIHDRPNQGLFRSLACRLMTPVVTKLLRRFFFLVYFLVQTI